MTSKMYTTVGPSLWGKNRFNENEKLIIEFLSFKFTNIFINKFKNTNNGISEITLSLRIFL